MKLFFLKFLSFHSLVSNILHMYSINNYNFFIILFIYVFLHLTKCSLMLTSEQQPLRLNPTEVHDVIAAVCAEVSVPNANVVRASTTLNNNSGKPSTDVAVSVLIKLVIDMYVSINCCLLSFMLYSFLVTICLALNTFSLCFTVYSQFL